LQVAINAIDNREENSMNYSMNPMGGLPGMGMSDQQSGMMGQPMDMMGQQGMMGQPMDMMGQGMMAGMDCGYPNLGSFNPCAPCQPEMPNHHHHHHCPEPAPQPTIYVVRKGDSVYKIAQKFGTTMQAIIIANNLSNPDLIFPGQVFYIPVA
jgi:nucleoid-associated protein YgaU